MTRASLLHIINHVGNISESEIRELEQLAATFPYCQTAHLLLAKAAHDQGSMLASQRLRRAATYAVDRHLLRQLLEQPAVAEPQDELPSAPKELPAPTEVSVTAAAAGGSTAFFQALVTEDVQVLELQEEAATEAVEESEAYQPAPVSAPAFADLPEPTAESETVAHATSEAASLVDQTEDYSKAPDNQEPTTHLSSLSTSTPAETLELEAAEVSDNAEPTSAELEVVDANVALAPETSALTNSEELLPAAAPPIRPPAEVGTSRFEFGLSEPEKQLIPILYQLPGLDEDELSEAPDESYPLAAPAATTALAPPFRADTELAYSLLPEGSRSGYALQLRDEELTQPLPGTEFFPPDALLHAHCTHRSAPTAPAPSSLDLINRFLKVQPRLKSPGIPSMTQEQADLAARSTHAAPALASESLAKILVKQGKKDRAIEIYEQLMVRQPEKSAYFADQIRQLKTSE